MTSRISLEPEAVLDVLKTHFDVPADTAVDTEFQLLDLDSLVLIELGVILSKQYGVDVTGDELASAGTAVQAAELVSEKAANS
ncbi:acyl carrier protein [Streptomyces sp. MZ04]|uniref:acyl carrier protein n=1 Tax=Streptomyces sp. MZ04 TaxID=2559236 RepID=UPI00107E8ADB|nr:acyl carrier protein [Streptomyces sp. MZ04]TGB13379.1 acyl carrier protein [Streptomyces sp. MZ04]